MTSNLPLPPSAALSVPSSDAATPWLVPPLLVPAFVIVATAVYACYRYIELGSAAFR